MAICVLEQLRAMDLDGATLGAAFRVLPALPDAVVRSAVLHSVWRQHWRVDLARPLSLGHVMRRVP
jgi:hypothetical protein